MAINRFNLVRAISTARKNQDYQTHDELLNIFYTLLEQEEINNDFITEINIYDMMSNSASKLLSECVGSISKQRYRL